MTKKQVLEERVYSGKEKEKKRGKEKENGKENKKGKQKKKGKATKTKTKKERKRIVGCLATFSCTFFFNQIPLSCCLLCGLAWRSAIRKGYILTLHSHVTTFEDKSKSRRCTHNVLCFVNSF